MRLNSPIRIGHGADPHLVERGISTRRHADEAGAHKADRVMDLTSSTRASGERKRARIRWHYAGMGAWFDPSQER